MSVIPDGFFTDGLLFWGDSFSPKTVLSKGYLIEVPDIRCLSVAQANAFHGGIGTFLSELDADCAIQFQWSVSSDYEDDLENYIKNAPYSDSKWSNFIRQDRFANFHKKIQHGTLRREVLAVFLSHQTNTRPKKGQSTAEEFETFMAAEKRAFDSKIERFSSLVGAVSVKPMDDADHFNYYTKFFDPAAQRIEERWLDPEESIIGNTLMSDIVTNEQNGDIVFKIGEYYHSTFVLTQQPSLIISGMIAGLMDCLSKDFCITQNLYGLDAQKEIKKEEKDLRLLMGNVQHTKEISLESTIQQKREKIRKLMTGVMMPYKALTIFRVWAKSSEELSVKNVALKTAISRFGGAKYHQVNQPSQAKKLFFETFPGRTGGNRRGWDLYYTNDELAGLAPISSSFTGGLKTAEALYEGGNGSLVGVNSFSGGTPQHAVLIGMTGAGKSVATCDFLTQTDPYFDYTAIIEEGLSYGVFTRLMGGDPIIMSPDADITINYLDTNELPLTTSHLSVAAKLCLKMIGISQNEDTNNYRSSVIGEYLNVLYWNQFENWKNRNKDLYKQCLQEAFLIEKVLKPGLEAGSSFLDGFVELAAIKRNDEEKYQSLLSGIDNNLLLTFEKSPNEGTCVRNMAFAFFKPEEFPAHMDLVELLKFEKMENHKAEEVDYLATMLSAWARFGDKGKLFDGVTNFTISGKVTHFELGYIPESAKELKEATGFLIANFVRQHIIKLPRKTRKRIVFEELSRFLSIPGGDVILSEAYAQLRKYSCWVLCVTQQFSQLKSTPLYKVIMGNSKLFLLMRQNNREDIEEIAHSIGLPDTAKSEIQNYPLPEHQKNKEERCSYMTVFALAGQTNACGTIKIKPSKEMLYVASSDGNVFDQRKKALSQYNSIFDGVLKEAS